MASSVKRGVGGGTTRGGALALTDGGDTVVEEATQAANKKSRTQNSSTAAIPAQIVHDAKQVAAGLAAKAPPPAGDAAMPAAEP